MFYSLRIDWTALLVNLHDFVSQVGILHHLLAHQIILSSLLSLAFNLFYLFASEKHFSLISPIPVLWYIFKKG